MGQIARSSKTGGGSALVDGRVAAAADVETDMGVVFTEINGQLDNTNIKAAADIDPTKVGDYSTDVTVITTAAVGDTGSPTKATDLAAEIQQLRYTVQRLTTGLGATFLDSDDAQQSIAWQEPRIVGPNLLHNASFDVNTTAAGTAPDGWDTEGTPSTLAFTNANTARGGGLAVQIVGSAADDGISQTLADLKPSTKYLVGGWVYLAAGTALRFYTTGAIAATNDYQDYDETYSTATTLKLISAVVMTDSSTPPTDLKLLFVSTALNDNFHVDDTFCYELGDDPASPLGAVVVQDTVGAAQAVAVATGWDDVDDLQVSVRVPSPGFTVYVRACLTVNADGGAAECYARILEGASPVGTLAHASFHADDMAQTIYLEYVNETPTPGATVTYKPQVNAFTQDAEVNPTKNSIQSISSLTVEMRPNGHG